MSGVLGSGGHGRSLRTDEGPHSLSRMRAHLEDHETEAMTKEYLKSQWRGKATEGEPDENGWDRRRDDNGDAACPLHD